MSTAAPGRKERLIWLDLARTAALVAMASFHFTVDLESFGFVPPGTTVSGGWAIYARLIAGSFLFLSGISLWLSSRAGLDFRRFTRRLVRIAGAALLVSAATYFAVPDAWIFFGILHMMAVASVTGLLFLRLPAGVTLAFAGLAQIAPTYLSGQVFDHPWLAWTGLATTTPVTLDFVPFLPWISPFLAGLALARLADRSGIASALAKANPVGARWAWLAFPGRHSLAVYLLHQPVLVGFVWLFSRLVS